MFRRLLRWLFRRPLRVADMRREERVMLAGGSITVRPGSALR